MKKVFALALLVVGLTTFAQEKGERKAIRENLSTEQKVDFQVKKMTKDLNLNEKQVKEVRVLVAKEVEKREAKRAEMKEIKAAKKTEMKAQMETEQAAVSSEMKKILTPDQFAKWEKIREERREKMKEKMAERREKRQPQELPESK
ncbi:hypothetical protein QWY90_11810 [Flavobacterium paronense]|uniref:LTXXQ motif family protein n=1 Tax=Flavobacterium paronense TaxID=1392775 RepID=A0ABV5GDL1_9FLAO|nr:hypothetical protein [Flavobacterium paronense]MDN3677991.1 hypothetical protein [Flavobacterium paronense]